MSDDANNTIGMASDLLEMREAFQTTGSHRDRKWQFFHHDRNHFSILPTEKPEVLFRGQHTRFSPCRSSLARRFTSLAELPLLSASDQAKLLDSVVRRLWFLQELRDHPAYQWLERRHLAGFDMALAQHYGIPTGYVDLTESFDVACFFATCRIQGDIWEPCASGTGLIYLLPIDGIPLRPDVLQPIGLQILPRPNEQWGWVIVIGTNSDFENVPSLRIFEFIHDENVGRQFLNRFNGGEALFPPDQMAAAAGLIMTSKILPRNTVLNALDDLITGGCCGPKNVVLDLLRNELGVTQGDVAPILRVERLDDLKEKWADENREFFTNVGFSLVKGKGF